MLLLESSLPVTNDYKRMCVLRYVYMFTPCLCIIVLLAELLGTLSSLLSSLPVTNAYKHVFICFERHCLASCRVGVPCAPINSYSLR